MRFMTSTFPSLSHISSSCPQRKPFRVPCKPDVTPLEILDINEGKKDGNIDIMKAIAQDLHKSDCNPLASAYSWPVSVFFIFILDSQ